MTRSRTVAVGSLTGAGFLVVAAMTLSLIVGVVTIATLAILEKPVPEALDKLTTGLAVAVPALLARTRPDPVPAAREDPQQ